MSDSLNEELVALFNKLDPFDQWRVGDIVYCLHCDGSFKAENVRFEDGLAVCPVAGHT